MKVRVPFLLLCLSYGIALAAQDTKPRIAIKTFENPVSYQNSTIGNALTEILTTELGKTGKYRIVEREAVAELVKEIDLGTTDWSKNPTFAKKGQFSGAEYFLLGKVTNFSYKEQAGQAQVSDYRGAHLVTIYLQQADVRVDFRVVSTATGEAVLTEAGNAHKGNQSYASEIAIWNRLLASGSFATAEFSSSLIGRATIEAVRDVVRKLSDLSSEVRTYSSTESLELILQQLGEAEGKILAEVGPEQFVVSLGSANGVLKGDRLKVYSEAVTKNKKGEVIYREQKEAGILEIIDVSMRDRAKARFLGSGQPTDPHGVMPREGDVVKIDVDYARNLRGSSKSGFPSRTGDTGSSAGGGADASEVQTLIKKGDRFVEDGYYSQALEQYRKGLAMNAGNLELLRRVATAQIYLRDFMEAEASAEKILDGGGSLAVPAGHYHAFVQRYCTGELVIEKGQLSFRTKNGEHDFNVPNANLISVQQGSVQQGTLQAHHAVPVLAIRWRDQHGSEKKYDLLLYTYLKQAPAGSYEFRLIGLDRETTQDTEKLNQFTLRLVQKYVK